MSSEGNQLRTYSLLLTAWLLVACTQTPGGVSGSGTAPSEPARTPKHLVAAALREPPSLHPDLMLASTTSGIKQSFLVAHNYLVVRDEQWRILPQLAQEVISLEKGTWRVNPDGTMDTTWKLRPNIKWHDGAPFTADDLVFTFGVIKDPEIPNSVGTVLRSMASVEALDPNTLVVHWSAAHVEANRGHGLVPMARHLLEATYRSDKVSFASSPVLASEFVGLGPYRLTRWEPGVQMEFARFDDYYLGRPPLDSIVLKFISDANAMVAAILAGSVDLLLPLGVDVEVAEDVKRRWEGTGNQVWGTVSGAMRYILIQHRPEYAHPQQGLTNRLVRQGFLHATDRETIANLATSGYSQAMDGWFPPTHELAPLVQPSIPRFPFDLRLAQQRLAEGGWVRSQQNELVHQATGERFEIELRSFQEGPAEKNLATIADGWQAVGARVKPYIVPGALNADPEYRQTLPGASITGQIWDMMYTVALDSRLIASPATRWLGSNRAGYINPAVDALYDRLAVTIGAEERLALHRALLQEVLSDVAYIPLYWEYAPILALKGVRGVGGLVDNANTWNVFEWTKE